MLADLNDNNQLILRYLRGDAVDQVLASEGPRDSFSILSGTPIGGAVLWLLTDRQGSVRDVTDGSGTIVDHIDYGSFGERVAETNPSGGSRYGYTGREWDAALELQDNRTRFYDPKAGLFIQEDSKGFGAGDANLTRYVGNGPTNGSDPSGLSAWDWIKRTGNSVGTAVWDYTLGAVIGLGGGLGDDIGTGGGELLYADPGKAIDLATVRRQYVLDQFMEIPSADQEHLTPDQFASEGRRAVFKGLNDNLEYAGKIGKGALAAAELAADVQLIIAAPGLVGDVAVGLRAGLGPFGTFEAIVTGDISAIKAGERIAQKSVSARALTTTSESAIEAEAVIEGAAARTVAPKTAYQFERRGISYQSDIATGANGESVIEHFITHNGERHTVGLSTISKEGELANSFQIPDQFRKLGISERMYAEADSVGFKFVKGSYNAGPDSVNFNNFWEHYHPAKGNVTEALFETPAGKVAKKYGLKPTAVNVTNNNIEVTWIKE